MERESFEDDETAAVLNRFFISIKVDREERPDIDSIYMTVCQALTGQGGWPLTIIMTPDKKPFFAGTYFPKKNRMGMPGLMDIIHSTVNVWKERRHDLIETGNKITEAVKDSFKAASQKREDISTETISKAYKYLLQSFDPKYGGFGQAPKFPSPHNLLFLLRYWKLHDEKQALSMVEKTLEAMYRGGIYDHIGFGFSRYSTDNKWLVPHFEKMLYDNALLAAAYLEAYQASRKDEYRNIAKDIFTYVLRDMTSPEGGFYSAEDADSEGVEGKFYVWEPEEVNKILGKEEGNKFCHYYDITKRGNFEGKSIPNLINREDDWLKSYLTSDNQRRMLFEHREKRIHPYKDDKILTSWNGLMIAALSMGARILNDKKLAEAAEKATAFILNNLCREDGRLLARYREGEASYLGYVDDYAFFIWGLIELYEATYNSFYLEKALEFNEGLIDYFWDNENGGLYLYGRDGEELITRPKEFYDGAMPSGNSAATLNFLRLAHMTGDIKLEEKAHEQFRFFGQRVNENPFGYSYFLVSFMFYSNPVKEIIIVGDTEGIDTKKMISYLREEYMPMSVSLLYSHDKSDATLTNILPFIKDYKMIDNKATAYICKNCTCHSPVTDINIFNNLLRN